VRIPRNSSSRSRVKAAAKREMKGDAIGELSIPQLDDDCLGRELIRLKLKDGLKREGASPIPDGRNADGFDPISEGLILVLKLLCKHPLVVERNRDLAKRGQRIA
jgi:hypothetical protein